MMANPKTNVDDPVAEERDPNSGLIVLSPEWVEWHLSKPLTAEDMVELERKLAAYPEPIAAAEGMARLQSLPQPTRGDYRRLVCEFEAKYSSPSRLSLLIY